jgi:hypothetical protein
MRRFGLLLVVSLCLVSSVAASPAAAEVDVSRSVTVPKPTQPRLAATQTPQPSGAAAAAAAPITCYFKVDNPHKSTHVSTNVNVQAHTDCTGPVSSITLTVYLYTYPAGRLVGVNGPKTASNTSSYRLNAAAACVMGQYYGYATTTVYFPPGYAPSPQSAQAYSSIILVNCWEGLMQLELLRHGTRSWSTLTFEGREWRNEQYLRAAFLAGVGANAVAMSASGPDPDTSVDRPEKEALWRLWIAKPDRARAEFVVGTETVIVIVQGGHWWSWSPLQGERRGGSDFRTGLGPATLFLDAPWLLRAIPHGTVGDHKEVAGRPGLSIAIEATSLNTQFASTESVWDAMPAVSVGTIETEFGLGATAYDLVVDTELGILLSAEAYFLGRSFRRCEVSALTVDTPLGPELLAIPWDGGRGRGLT